MNGWRIAEVAQLERTEGTLYLDGRDTGKVYIKPGYTCKLCRVHADYGEKLRHLEHCPVALLRKEEEMADGVYGCV